MNEKMEMLGVTNVVKEKDHDYEEKVIERWSKLRFLDGVTDEERKRCMALSFEDAAIELISLSDGEAIADDKRGFYETMEVISFPILRRIIADMKKPRIIGFNELVEFINGLTVGNIIIIQINELAGFANKRPSGDDSEMIEHGIQLGVYIERLNKSIAYYKAFVGEPKEYGGYFTCGCRLCMEGISRSVFDTSVVELINSIKTKKDDVLGALYGSQSLRYLTRWGGVDYEAEMTSAICKAFTMHEDGELYRCGIRYDENFIKDLIGVPDNTEA